MNGMIFGVGRGSYSQQKDDSQNKLSSRHISRIPSCFRSSLRHLFLRSILHFWFSTGSIGTTGKYSYFNSVFVT